MSTLPGVKVGPLDPDSTAGFGQIGRQNTARQIIRLHAQMHPQALRNALARPLDVPLTNGLDLGEVSDYLSGLQHPNGDPVLPDDGKLVGATVRGEKNRGHVVTFTYELPSGRTTKWFAPYDQEHLPNSFEDGQKLTDIQQMRERGVVSFDSQGTHTAILERELANARRERDALRRTVESGAVQGEAPEQTADEIPTPDSRSGELLATELEKANRENAELRERLAALEAVADKSATEAALGAGEADDSGDEGDEPDPGSEQTISQDPPFEGYDGMNAAAVAEYLKSPERTAEERQAVLDYEQTHANRRTVISAGELSLGTGGQGTGA